MGWLEQAHVLLLTPMTTPKPVPIPCVWALSMSARDHGFLLGTMGQVLGVGGGMVASGPGF